MLPFEGQHLSSLVFAAFSNPVIFLILVQLKRPLLFSELDISRFILIMFFSTRNLSTVKFYLFSLNETKS
jgi:hypothetical protein